MATKVEPLSIAEILKPHVDEAALNFSKIHSEENADPGFKEAIRAGLEAFVCAYCEQGEAAQSEQSGKGFLAKCLRRPQSSPELTSNDTLIINRMYWDTVDALSRYISTQDSEKLASDMAARANAIVTGNMGYSAHVLTMPSIKRPTMAGKAIYTTGAPGAPYSR